MAFEADRDKNGHFTSKPDAIMQYSFTSANAADMARRRWEKYREAAADAVAEEMGTIVPGVTTPESAWGVLNARLATQIMDSDKPRGGDLTDLGRNMGAIPNAYERTEKENSYTPPSAAHAALELVAGTFATIMRDVLQLHEQREPVIDGSVTETGIPASNNLRIGEPLGRTDSTPPAPTPPTNEQET
jgi:hypothetical protein